MKNYEIRLEQKLHYDYNINAENEKQALEVISKIITSHSYKNKTTRSCSFYECMPIVLFIQESKGK
jgi:hypothetical protein